MNVVILGHVIIVYIIFVVNLINNDYKKTLIGGKSDKIVFF